MPASPATNPFTLLSLIAAPAVLTNAASLLVLSTSNRFARAIDRARALVGHLKSANAATDPESPTRLVQLKRAERRSLLLLTSLRAFYLSIGAFAFASLVSLVGAGIASSPYEFGLSVAMFVSLASGIVGVGSLVYGCVILVRETRIAVYSIVEETKFIEQRSVVKETLADAPV
ncbi:MAG TPA: DUF2721 domain-containing protein [Polyangiaceae bacterium]|jgi:hypothetical protein|nr:DUF2721 domain-containing protein [Polyangiaceae bacterium]